MEKVENNISVILGLVAGMFGFAILFQVRNGIKFSFFIIDTGCWCGSLLLCCHPWLHNEKKGL